MADNNIIISDPSKASSKEVARIIASLVRSIKVIKESLSGDIQNTAKQVKSVEKQITELVKELSAEIKSVEARVKDKAYKDLNAEVYKIERLIQDVPQFSPVQLEEKFGAVIRDLEQRFDDKVNTMDMPLLPTAEETREALESLEGDERLNWTAVNGVVGIHVGKTPPQDTRMLWLMDR